MHKSLCIKIYAAKLVKSIMIKYKLNWVFEFYINRVGRDVSAN